MINRILAGLFWIALPILFWAGLITFILYLAKG